MAKAKDQTPKPYRVTLNGWDGYWDVDAADEDAAITLAIQESKSQRDRRNFRAVRRDQDPTAPVAPVPALPR